MSKFSNMMKPNKDRDNLVLLYLWRKQSLSQIAAKLHKSKRAIQMVKANLIEDGYISEPQRYQRHVELTSAGLERLNQAFDRKDIPE